MPPGIEPTRQIPALLAAIAYGGVGQSIRGALCLFTGSSAGSCSHGCILQILTCQLRVVDGDASVAGRFLVTLWGMKALVIVVSSSVIIYRFGAFVVVFIVAGFSKGHLVMLDAAARGSVFGRALPQCTVGHGEGTKPKWHTEQRCTGHVVCTGMHRHVFVS